MSTSLFGRSLQILLVLTGAFCISVGSYLFSISSNQYRVAWDSVEIAEEQVALSIIGDIAEEEEMDELLNEMRSLSEARFEGVRAFKEVITRIETQFNYKFSPEDYDLAMLSYSEQLFHLVFEESVYRSRVKSAAIIIAIGAAAVGLGLLLTILTAKKKKPVKKEKKPKNEKKPKKKDAKNKKEETSTKENEDASPEEGEKKEEIAE